MKFYFIRAFLRRMQPGDLCNFLSKCNNNTWFFAFGFTIIEADRCPASLRAWHRLSRDHRKRRISHDEAHFHLEAGAG
jgi:N-acetylglutamate synthase-like GNAT family acetyltransferase